MSFSRESWVVSDSLWCRRLQHTRLLCHSHMLPPLSPYTSKYRFIPVLQVKRLRLRGYEGKVTMKVNGRDGSPTPKPTFFLPKFAVLKKGWMWNHHFRSCSNLSNSSGDDDQNSDNSFGNGKKDTNGRSINGQSMDCGKENIYLGRV